MKTVRYGDNIAIVVMDEELQDILDQQMYKLVRAEKNYGMKISI